MADETRVKSQAVSMPIGKQGKASSNIEHIPLPINVVSINYFKSKAKSSMRYTGCGSFEFLKKRREKSEKAQLHGHSVSHHTYNKIYVKKKENTKDEFSFSDYKIKFGKELQVPAVKQSLQIAKEKPKKKKLEIMNNFVEVKQKEADNDQKEQFRPHGQGQTPSSPFAKKRVSMTKGQKRPSPLPEIKMATSYSKHRKRISIDIEMENKLDGWGGQNSLEEEDPKMDISEYARRWNLKVYYSERGKSKEARGK